MERLGDRTRSMRISRAIVALTVVLMPQAWARPLAAQGSAYPAREGESGAMMGRVLEAATRRPLAADILVDDGAAGRMRAAEDGTWHIGNLTEGRHRVRIRYPGYLFRDANVDVRSGTTDTVNVELEQAIVPLSAVVVTAARREQRLADAVVETELISNADVKRSGASELASVLTERTGIELDGGVPAGAGAQMRGFNSRRVLVLLDGQPLVGRINGNFDLSRLPTSMVERIEVVKGPQSTLYGSDAMGGVINIISRRPPENDQLTGGITSTVGSAGRREIGGDAGWRGGAWSFTASGGHRGIDLAPGISGDASTFARRNDGAGTLRWDRDSTQRLELGLLGIGERQRYRTGQLFHFADNTQLGVRLTSLTNLWGGKLTATLGGSSFEHLSRASTLDRPASDSGARDLQRLGQGSVVFNGRARGVQYDVGAEVREETIDADRVVASSRVLRQAEPFAQATLGMGTLSIMPGVRLTSSNRWGEFVAPRLAAMWRPAPALAFRAALGRGFRAPDFKELYLDFVNSAAGYAVKGNPNLQPESSTSLSLGVEWDAPTVYLRTSVYRNAYRDFIDTRQPDASGTYTYDNVARGTTAGMEVEAGMFVSRWRLDGSVDLLHTHDESTGGPLLGRPPHAARFTASGPIALGVRAALSSSYVGRTPVDLATGGLTRDRESYSKVDARFTRLLGRGVEAGAGVANLFDKQLGDAWPGFTGRQVYVSLTWRNELTR